MHRREILIAALLAPLAKGLKEVHDDPLLTRDLLQLQGWPTQLPSSRAAVGKISTRSDRWGVAGRASQAPAIDGTLDEPLWSDAESHTGFVTPFYHQAIDADVSLRFAYDDGAVYVAVSYASEDAGASVAAIDVLLSPGGGGAPTFRAPLIIRAVKPAYSNDWGPGITDLADVDSAFVANDDGITAELKVPLADLDMESVKDGDEWRANVIIQHEMMTKPLSTWIPIRTSMHRYNGQGGAGVQGEVTAGAHLGTIFMGAIPTLPQRTKPPQMFTPDQSSLTYRGYTDKELSFALGDIKPRDQVRLEWKSPDGTWTPVEKPSEERDRSTITITFSHPTPTDKGHYQLRVLVERSQPRERNADKVALLTFDRLDLIRAGRQVQPTAAAKRTTRVPKRAASKEAEHLLGLIPDRSGFRFVGLPDQPLLHPDKVFLWDPNQPDVLASAHSDLVYPHEKYPEDQLITVTNRLGDSVEYPYHEDADGKRYFISSHIWFQKREYILTAIEELAAKDPLGAARVLYGLSQAYPGWVPTNEYPWFNRPVESASVPANYYWGGTWSRWSASELNGFRHLPAAYALVAETDALDVLSDEVGADVRKAIVDDMFEPSIDFHRSYSMIYHNMDYTNNLGVAAMAQAFDDSDYLHEVVEWAVEYARLTYLFDGFFKETSLSYHDQATGGLVKVIDAIQGWTDPEGFVSPRTGLRFEDLDLGAETPVLAGAQAVGNLVVYPDGKLLPMDDTWAVSEAGEPQLEAGSFLLPASGVVRMARGSQPDTASQAYLKFTTKYGHHHYDPLGLALYAEGQELLPDIGYTHTFYRRWSMSGLAHNTVVVDSADMHDEGAAADGGDIEVFAQPSETVQVTRASQGAAYPQTDEFRREVWSIGFGSDDNAGYLLDLFRVKGGDRHEYTLHGDANHDATLSTDAELADYGPYLLPEGVQVTEPTTEIDYGDAEGHYYGYIYVRKVQRAELADGSFTATLATQDDAGKPLSGAKIIGLGDGVASELFIGESPSMRSTRLEGTSKDINSEAVKYWMPKLVVRRDGTDLDSRFVTLIEPYAAGGNAQVTSVERLTVDQGGDDAIAVQVTHAGGIDLVLSSRDPDQPMVVGDVTLQGKLGMIRMTGDKVTAMHLVGGTSLSKGSNEITDDGPITGTITGVRRRADGDDLDALIADAAIPDSMVANTLVVMHPDDTTHGYKIKSVASEGGSTVVEVDGVDPGFTFGEDRSTELQFFPFTTWTGDTTFRLENSVHHIP